MLIPRPLAVRPEELRSDPACKKTFSSIGSPSRKALWGRKEKPMHEWQSLSHVRWECKYHIVIIPKYRRKVFYGRLKRQIGAILVLGNDSQGMGHSG